MKYLRLLDSTLELYAYNNWQWCWTILKVYFRPCSTAVRFSLLLRLLPLLLPHHLLLLLHSCNMPWEFAPQAKVPTALVLFICIHRHFLGTKVYTELNSIAGGVPQCVLVDKLSLATTQVAPPELALTLRLYRGRYTQGERIEGRGFSEENFRTTATSPQ